MNTKPYKCAAKELLWSDATHDDKNSCRWLHSDLLIHNLSSLKDTLFGHQSTKVATSEAYSFPQLLKKWSIRRQICESKNYYVCRHGN